jgi:ABC-type nitrate/sulfonate/bicarbonate transport system ATPase subunit
MGGMGKEKVLVDISKRFGQLLVLDGVKFGINENEFLALVGPSGCGKTTLANIIGGLILPTEGGIWIDGQLVNPRQHNLSFVFQEPSCIPWRTIREDMKIGLEIKKFSGNSLKERVRRVIHLVGLDGFENYYPHQISGGMKQRVAIARAYATDPDLLLMDEPFGHLDAQTRYLMQMEILRIWEEMKRTVIFVTNNIEEAVFLAERIIVFSKLPARIRGEIRVDLPRPRDNISPEFLAVRSSVSALCESCDPTE